MFETQPRDRSFDFNIILDEKQENDMFFQTQDQFPEDVLVREQGVMCYSSRGAHKHNYDQFDFVVKEDFVLAAVYDGHGGPTVSLYLKENLLRNVVNHDKFVTQPITSLIQCIQDIEEEVVQKFDPVCGSTLLLVLWKKDQILVASIGDGLCYGFKDCQEFIFDADQQKKQNSNQKKIKPQNKKVLMNEIHNLQNEQQRQKIKSKGGLILRQKNSYRVAGQLSLSRSIGDNKYKQWISATPSIRKYRNKFSHLILATDGFGSCLKSINNPLGMMGLIENLPYLRDNSTFLLVTRPHSFECKSQALASAC